MEKAQELLATDPGKAAALLTGSILKRLDVLETKTNYLLSLNFSGKKANYPSDFEFGVKYGTIDDIDTLIHQGAIGFGDIRKYLPLIQMRKDKDALLERLHKYDKTLKGATRSRPNPTRTSEEAKRDVEALARRLKLPQASWQGLPPERRLYAPAAPLNVPMTSIPAYQGSPVSFKGGVSAAHEQLERINSRIAEIETQMASLREKATRQEESVNAYPEYRALAQERSLLLVRRITLQTRPRGATRRRKLTRRKLTRKQ